MNPKQFHYFLLATLLMYHNLATPFYMEALTLALSLVENATA